MFPLLPSFLTNHCNLAEFWPIPLLPSNLNFRFIATLESWTCVMKACVTLLSQILLLEKSENFNFFFPFTLWHFVTILQFYFFVGEGRVMFSNLNFSVRPYYGKHKSYKITSLTVTFSKRCCKICSFKLQQSQKHIVTSWREWQSPAGVLESTAANRTTVPSCKGSNIFTLSVLELWLSQQV